MTTTPNHSEASPSAINPRYLLGNEANRIFMASQTYGFLDFGRGFPTEQGGAGWLNDDGSIDPEQGIQTWITCRMTHVYAIGKRLGQVAGIDGHDSPDDK